MAAIGELGRKRLKALLRRPVAAGDHRHGAGQCHNLLHPLHRKRGGFVDRYQRAAAHGRRRDRGNPHVREREVDPVDRRAIDLGRNIAAGHILADQPPLVAGLEHRIASKRPLCRARCQFAVAQRPARCGVGDAAVCGGKFTGRNAQPVGSFGQQRRAHRRARTPHRDFAGKPDRGRTARDHQRHRARHHSDHRIGHQPGGKFARHAGQEALGQRGVGERRICRSLLDPDLLPIGIQLIGKHLAQCRVRALSEIDVGRIDRDGIVLGDLHPGRKAMLALADGELPGRGLGGAVGPPHAEDAATHHQRAAGKEDAALDALALGLGRRRCGFGKVEIGGRVVGHHATPCSAALVAGVAAAAEPVAARIALRMRG